MVRGHLWGTSPFIGNHSVICSSISDVRVFGLHLPELPRKQKTIAKKAPINQLLVNLEFASRPVAGLQRCVLMQNYSGKGFFRSQMCRSDTESKN